MGLQAECIFRTAGRRGGGIRIQATPTESARLQRSKHELAQAPKDCESNIKARGEVEERVKEVTCGGRMSACSDLGPGAGSVPNSLSRSGAVSDGATGALAWTRDAGGQPCRLHTFLVHIQTWRWRRRDLAHHPSSGSTRCQSRTTSAQPRMFAASPLANFGWELVVKLQLFF